MRTLEDQVEPELARKFLIAKDALFSLRAGGRASSYYIAEIGRAVDAGMFLSVLMLSFSLLELWLRDLLVIAKAMQRNPKSKLALRYYLTKIDQEVEGLERGMSLGAILDNLVSLEVLQNEERQEIKNQFMKYRNPLMHGAFGRFTRTCSTEIEPIDNPSKEQMLLIEIFEGGIMDRSARIEDTLDYESYKAFEFVVNFLANHQIPKKI